MTAQDQEQRAFGSLSDRVAVITGGASGIGAATVEQFLSAGARVVIGDMNAEAGAQFVSRLSEQGYKDQVRFQAVDVAEEEQVIALVDVAEREFGGLDIVFNNAGIGGAIGPITELEVEHWDQTFAVMTRGVFLGIKLVPGRCNGQAEVARSSIRPQLQHLVVKVDRWPTPLPKQPL